MSPNHWTVLLAKDESGGVLATLVEESPDGLDLVEIARAEFGPFDTARDVTNWLLRLWAPRVDLLLR